MPGPTDRRTLRRSLRARAGAVLVPMLACMAFAAWAQPAPPQPRRVSLEYAVKATYLYKFAPFVNWPPGTFASPRQPLRICVAGKDPFGEYLEHAVAGRRFGTHPFEVRRLERLTPDAGCQIVFISRLASQSLREALDAVSGRPVLTVVDSVEPRGGGIVQFVIERRRVRFVIDTGAAARNHITISSKLLNLALAVREPS